MGALSDINLGKFLVLGRAGTATTGAPGLGKHLTWVIRSVKRPVLVVTKAYTEPSRVLLAFDGSAVTRKGVEMLAASPLLKGLPIHLVMGAYSHSPLRQLFLGSKTSELLKSTALATLLLR